MSALVFLVEVVVVDRDNQIILQITRLAIRD